MRMLIRALQGSSPILVVSCHISFSTMSCVVITNLLGDFSHDFLSLVREFCLQSMKNISYIIGKHANLP